MNWIILIVAGLCEVGFTYCLGRAKSVEGLEWWLWIGGFLIFSIVSMTLLAKATQTLPIGVAYPVWTGIGAVGTQYWLEYSFSTSQLLSGGCYLRLRL